MAAGLIVTCPECEKKFKPKTDVSGKRIKCPFCAEAFVVPAPAQPPKTKSAAAKSGKPNAAKAGTTAAAAPPDEKAPVDDFDDNPDPYGVKTVELVPRCPNCTEEMGEHDTICLACGYNTMMRTWGKTEKTIGLTSGRHLMYLLPALGAAGFVLFAIITLLIYDVLVPYWVAGSWMDFVDSEAVRMWTTVMFLFWFWMAGLFCFKKFIDKPKPDELQMEESAD
jgi:hypothetical protein